MNNTDNKLLSAFLYTRVSTEEQAIRGGSLKTQQDTLRQYCLLKNIRVDKIFVEDHSAKTFNRPEWKRLMIEIDKSNTRPNLILFTRWDRFSRNTGDAYYVISKLKKLGVEPQAIEQPLDLSIPENKMMFAFYLAIPEVENDRRGLNTKIGLQRAKESGRWMGKAPIGYKNYCLADGSKMIIPKEPEASIIRYCFYQMANLRCNFTEAYQEAIKAGMQCSRSNFWHVLQNPAYTGNIRIKGNQNASDYLVPGLHSAIVSVPTFKKVQELFYRERNFKDNAQKTNLRQTFLLRGFVACPRCGRLLTASPSRSHTGRRYYYYHCRERGHYRIRHERLLERMIEKLKVAHALPKYNIEYKNLVQINYAKETQQIVSHKTRNLKSIELFTERIHKAKNLLLDSHIDFQQYASIKSDLEAKIRLLGYQVDANSKKQIELAETVEKTSNLLNALDSFFNLLQDKNRYAFINIILERGVNWEGSNPNSMFKKTFQFIYGLNDSSQDSEIPTNEEITNFLKQLSDMELLIKA